MSLRVMRLVPGAKLPDLSCEQLGASKVPEFQRWWKPLRNLRTRKWLDVLVARCPVFLCTTVMFGSSVHNVVNIVLFVADFCKTNRGHWSTQSKHIKRLTLSISWADENSSEQKGFAKWSLPFYTYACSPQALTQDTIRRNMGDTGNTLYVCHLFDSCMMGLKGLIKNQSDQQCVYILRPV